LLRPAPTINYHRIEKKSNGVDILAIYARKARTGTDNARVGRPRAQNSRRISLSLSPSLSLSLSLTGDKGRGGERGKEGGKNPEGRRRRAIKSPSEDAADPHSWREIIAPRDCRRIAHRAILRPAAESSTSESGRARYLQPRTPVESRSVPTTPCTTPSQPPPLERNEQRAISLLLNACHKSPRAPSRPLSPSPTPSSAHHHPVEMLSLSLSVSLSLYLVSPLLPWKIPPSLTRVPASPLSLSRLGSISLHCVSSLLFSARLLRALFFPLSHHASSSATLASKGKGKRTRREMLILRFLQFKEK